MGNLSDIKVDDKIYTQGIGAVITILTVDRLTDTQVICGTRRFKKGSGIEIGTADTWSSIYAYPLTEAIQRKYDVQQLDNRLRILAARISDLKVNDENYEEMLKLESEIRAAMEALRGGIAKK